MNFIVNAILKECLLLNFLLYKCASVSQ